MPSSVFVVVFTPLSNLLRLLFATFSLRGLYFTFIFRRVSIPAGGRDNRSECGRCVSSLLEVRQLVGWDPKERSKLGRDALIYTMIRIGFVYFKTVESQFSDSALPFSPSFFPSHCC